MNDAFQMGFFGGHQGKAFLEIKTHLVSKNTAGAGAGTITFIGSRRHDMLKEIKVLLHGCKLQLNPESVNHN